MATNRARLLFLPLVILLNLIAAAALAQATVGVVRGVVVDKEGEPLPGATVVVVNQPLGVSGVGTVTDAKGEFRFAGLPAGKGYALKVSLAGHQQLEFAVDVHAGKTVVQNVTLREAFEERVRVEGKSEVVNTESAKVSTALNEEFISGLPLLGTDYQDLLTLAPGVTDVNGTGNPNIHGARDTDVVTLVDGVNTTDPFSGLYGQNLNSESIQEIEIVTGAAGAEDSGGQGGFIKIMTKSGGNEFRGSFTFAMRTHRLDGDGAGSDPAELRGGLGESDGFRDQAFTDLYPYLSVSGAFVKDHLWYFLAPEYIQEEIPINAGSQTYVEQLTDTRVTGKVTWQASSENKVSFSVLFDDQAVTNQGVDTRTDLDSGFTFRRGGPTLTLQDVAIFSPKLSLESTLSRLDQTFEFVPTIDPDTNGNGILQVDARRDLGGNQDGFINLRETDPGQDLDGDGRWDVFEDFNGNDSLDGCTFDPVTGARTCTEDRDGDGRLTGALGCEGDDREDFNCNGRLDFESDFNQNGQVDPEEDRGIPCEHPTNCPGDLVPHTRGNGRFDTEDRNGNQLLDDSPYRDWVDANANGVPERGEFRAPLPADAQYSEVENSGRVSGPFFLTYSDSRTRSSLREDLSWYVDDLFGSHDLRMGALAEFDGYSADFTRRSNRTIRHGALDPATGRIGGTVFAFVPTVTQASNTASGEHLGMWITDVYKPLPNLTLSFGLRYDREAVGSHGYEYFEPAVQRREFDLLTGIRGVESGGDLNADGIVTRSLESDPLYTGQVELANPLRVPVLSQNLGAAAVSRFTRHNFLTSIESEKLQEFGIDDPLMLRNGRPRQEQDFTITNNNLAPRISVSWDPAGDGKTRTSASWGRYYGRLFLDSVVREAGPDFMNPYYGYDSDGVDPLGVPNNHVGRVISKSPPNAFQVDRNLKTPYTEELLIGFQREIGPELSVSFNYIRREFLDQLQDIDVNHSVRTPGAGGICGQSATSSGYCDDFGLIRVFPAMGGGGEAGKNGPDERVPDGYPDLYINNFNFNQIFRIGNYNVQDYVGYELQLVRRLHRKWQMTASYVWSKATGQADSFDSESGDDPALTELRQGYQNFDQTHVARFFATAFLPGDWRVGGGVEWTSGLPYSMVNRFSSSDNVDFPQLRKVYGHRDPNTGRFVSEDRNIHRNHAAYRLDARVEKQFVMGHVSAGAFFEVVNLLNSDALRITEVDDRRLSLQANQVREFGRRFEFGFRMNF